MAGPGGTASLVRYMERRYSQTVLVAYLTGPEIISGEAVWAFA